MKTNASIGLLDRQTSERIAAGEVVDRPLSVVKELVENAVDSGATTVFADLEDGGHKLIKITDNGCGIYEEELPLAVKRFATSKIRDFDDIASLLSLGFRGEALPSIGAVSRLEIVSKPQEQEFAHSITVEGGNVLDLRSAPGDSGTTVSVAKLFFNTPARKKFQKSAACELSQITNLLSQIAVSRRDIHFRLRNGSRIIFNYPASMGVTDCLLHMWTLKDASLLQPFSAHEAAVSVNGYICNPDFNRSTRGDIIVFVNGRLVRNNQISQAVIEGCAPFLPARRFPCALVNINLPPSETDVNVHPAKTEIRFGNGNMVFSLVRSAVMQAVKGIRDAAIPSFGVTFRDGNNDVINYNRSTGEVFERSEIREPQPKYHSQPNPGYQQTRPSKQQIDSYMDAVGYFEKRLEDLPDGQNMPAAPTAAQLPLSEEKSHSFIPLMQLYDTYIAANLDGNLVLIDQHAAHEKIIYEELVGRDVIHASVASQSLLFSHILELPVSYFSVLKDNAGIFLQLGFDLEEFGSNTFRIRALPFFIDEAEVNDFFIDVLDSIIAESASKAGEPLEKIRHIIACRSAVKANKKMSPEEMSVLYNRLIKLKEPFFCPHGRPVLIHISKKELEKMFKRIN